MGRSNVIWQLPLPRQEWNEDFTEVIEYEQEEESWLELFIDLVFVAMLINLGNIIATCGVALPVIFRCMKYFLIFFTSRLILDEYSNRFLSNDFTHRMLYFVYTLGLFLMAAYVQTDIFSTQCGVDDDLFLGFSIGYFLTRITIVAIYGLLMNYNEKAKKQFLFTLGIQLISFVLVLIGFIIDRENAAAQEDVNTIYVIASLIELGGRIIQPLVLKRMYKRGVKFQFFPVNIYSTQKRLGIFTLIVMGESFVALITLNPQTGNNKRVIIFLFCSLVLVFSKTMAFFDAVQRKEDEHQHAMIRSKIGGMVWQVSHVIVGFTLFLTGAGLKTCYKSVIGNMAIRKSFADLIAIGCSCSVIMFGFMRSIHKGIFGKNINFTPAQKRKRVIHYSVYFFIALFHALLLFKKQSEFDDEAEDNTDFFIIYHMLISMFLNVIDSIFSYYKMKREEKYLNSEPSSSSSSSENHHSNNPLNHHRVTTINSNNDPNNFDDGSRFTVSAVSNSRKLKHHASFKVCADELDDGIPNLPRKSSANHLIPRNTFAATAARPSQPTFTQQSTATAGSQEDRISSTEGDI